MKTHLLLGSVALLALATPALAQETPQAYPENSGLDVPIDEAKPADAAPAPTGDAVLDRLNTLEARIRQLEARNAELEASSAEVATRVEKVEVRAATAVQSGPAPTFADVTGDFTFKPRGTFQLDYAAYNEGKGGYDYNNGTDIRRARFGFDGTAFKKFKWRIEAEYVKSTVNLLDAYIQYALNPKWSVTFGQQKAPFGLEANSTDAFNSFLERGMANTAFGAIGAERRVGVNLGYASDHLYANLGVFGAGEAVQRNADSPDEAQGINGRIVWEPIVDTDKLVHVGVSGYRASNFQTVAAVSSVATCTGSTAATCTFTTAAAKVPNTVRLSDRPGSRIDGGNLIDTGSITNVRSATFVGGELALVKGPFSIQGEYDHLTLDRYGADPSLSFDGFYVFGSWFLTGESRAFKGGSADRLKPFNDFNPSAGKWGAVELLVRYDQIDLSDYRFGTGTNLTNAGKGTSWTGGINWYLNPNTKFVFNYIHFKGDNSPLNSTGKVGKTAPIQAEGDVLGTRLQFDF